MLRTALLFLGLLGFLVSTATAGTARRTPAAMRSHRLTRGHHTHVYKDYPYHSRERAKLVSIARITHPRPTGVRYSNTAAHPASTTSKHTTGIF